ncbi:hypothetical protein CXG81DRAFT_30096 [Caulochytrium protostelioides]|uniref:GP-PDE domain-containing protein n=1 Tax=Caulochytrium protostelioides TaxID=1555241 RepID=A0A4P9X4A5_9FUNG|nr:hypothetical protein CXG81DRAFT_30096 [Caulochytrium protostelioides]|eukprot:RKO99897.1 hypothetical protein CXG81DRAFT_30096 [Caulochytrium protostelioides]
MSHRGGSLEYIENSLPGFRYSARVLRVSLLETDVHLTRDGQIVLFHDDDMGRMCGPAYAGRAIHDFDYADLPPLVVPAFLKDHPHVVNDKDATRIPLLEEVFRELPRYPIQIDIKGGPRELADKTAALIRQYGHEGSVVWGSFRQPQSDYCAAHPDIPRFTSFRKLSWALLAHWFGLLGWVQLPEQMAVVPYLGPLKSASFWQALGDRGVAVIPFGPAPNGINDPTFYEEIRRRGAAGICTDRPTLLATWLQTHRLRVPTRRAAVRDKQD